MLIAMERIVMVNLKKYVLLLLACVSLGYAVHYWALQRGHIDTMTDQNCSSCCAFQEVMRIPSPDFNLKHFVFTYPPLHSMITSNLLSWSRSYSWTIFLLNSFYLLLLIASLYLLGKELGNALIGYFAALIMLLYPHTFFLFHMYSLDLPLTAVVTLSVCLLIKSQSFKSIPWTLAFSASSVWGLLIKDPFGAFLIGPVSISAIAALRRIAKQRKFGQILNLAVPILIVGPVIYIFYLQNHYLQDISLPRPVRESYGGGIPSIATTGLWKYQLTPLFFLLWVAGLAVFFRRCVPARWLIILWIIVPNLIVALMPHWKSVRYVMPAHPAFALISAFAVGWAVDKIKTRSAVVLISVLALVGTWQIMDLVHGDKLLSRRAGGWRYFGQDNNSCISLDQRRESEAILLSLTREMSLSPGHSFKVITNSHEPILYLVEKYAALQGADLRMAYSSELSRDDWERNLQDTEWFVLMPRGPVSRDIMREGFAFDWLVDDYNYNVVGGGYDKPLEGETLARKKRAWDKIAKHFVLVRMLRFQGNVIYLYRSPTLLPGATVPGPRHPAGLS